MYRTCVTAVVLALAAGLSGCASNSEGNVLPDTGIYVSSEERGRAYDWHGLTVNLRRVSGITVIRADAVQVGIAGIWGVRVEVDDQTRATFDDIVLQNKVDVVYLIDGKVGLGYRVDGWWRMPTIEEIREGRGGPRVFLWMGRDIGDRSEAERVAKMLSKMK